MNLANELSKEHIFIVKNLDNTDAFYSEFSVFLKTQGIINDPDKIKRLFIKRENVQSTAIGRGAAAPHIFSEEFKQFTFCLALIQDGIDFKAPDENPVFLVFLIMSDEREVGLHLKSLAHIARLVSCTDIVAAMKSAQSTEEVVKILLEKDKLI